MEDVDFEEEEEEEEGNEEGWVLEPQEGVVGSMEGPDDSEVTFALHSGRARGRPVRHSLQAHLSSRHPPCAEPYEDVEAGRCRPCPGGAHREGQCDPWRRAWLLESVETAGFKSCLAPY